MVKPPSLWPHDMFSNHVILITGASSGIGKALAIHLARLGATLVLLGRRAETLAATDEAIKRAGGQAAYLHPMDLVHANWQDYEEMADRLRSEWGELQGLVLTAAMAGQFSPITHHPPHMWHQVLQLNLNAPFLMCRTLWPLLEASKSPASIVFAGAPEAGKPYAGSYGISKQGVQTVAHMLHTENPHSTVRVNTVIPGPTRTPLHLQGYPASSPDTQCSPEEAALPFIYLLSPMSCDRGKTLDATTWSKHLEAST